MTQHIPGGAVDLSSLVAAGPGQKEPQPPMAANAAGGGPGEARPEGQTVEVPSVILDVTDQTFEQIMQLSQVVPIVVDLWAEWCGPCKTLTPILEKVTLELAGKAILAKVDVDANPGLAQAFQAQSIPTVVALVAGQPVPLFQGAVPEAQVRQVFEQLLQLANEQGVRGRVNSPEISADQSQGETEPEPNPAHAAALAAVTQGDLATAVAEYEAVLNKAPGDDEARAALVQVKLLERLDGKNSDEIRAAAADAPNSIEAALQVADLDVSGGHVEDAFVRLLDLFERSAAEDRERVQEHLLELFEVVGVGDSRVIAARRRFASLLF